MTNPESKHPKGKLRLFLRIILWILAVLIVV